MTFPFANAVRGVRWGGYGLIGLVVVSLWGCSSDLKPSSEELWQANMTDFRDHLRLVVHDPDRLQRLLDVFDQAAAELKVGLDQIVALRQEDVRLNGNPQTATEDLRQQGVLIQSHIKTHRAKIIRARMALAHLATDDEWKKITSRRLAIFKAKGLQP
jgi:hypothetical protein